jgi:hypothetical protein
MINVNQIFMSEIQSTAKASSELGLDAHQSNCFYTLGHLAFLLVFGILSFQQGSEA